MKDQDIAGIENHGPLLIRDVVEHSQREADEIQLLAAAAPEQQGLNLSGVGDAQFASGLAPGGKAHGHEAILDAALANQLIQLAQQLGGKKFQRRHAAENADGHGALEGSRGALSADVAEREAQARGAVA